MKTSDFPSVREARLTVEKHMERYKKLMGIKKGKTMIELPRLNSVSVMTSTELIASLRAESDELIKYQFSHTKEAMSCLQRLHDLSLEAADALQALEPDDSGIVPDSDKVICPGCSHQFTAIPGNVQARLQALERVPMTEEQARQLWITAHAESWLSLGSGSVAYLNYKRAIEAHHGITKGE